MTVVFFITSRQQASVEGDGPELRLPNSKISRDVDRGSLPRLLAQNFGFLLGKLRCSQPTGSLQQWRPPKTARPPAPADPQRADPQPAISTATSTFDNDKGRHRNPRRNPAPLHATCSLGPTTPTVNMGEAVHKPRECLAGKRVLSADPQSAGPDCLSPTGVPASLRWSCRKMIVITT